MSELIEIILQAVDNASSVFSSVTDSVSGMADSLSGTADTVSSDFTAMETNVSGFQTAVSNIDSSSIDDLATELGMSTEEVERLIQSGAQIGSIQFNEAAAGAGELESSVSSADTAVEDLDSDLDIINSSMLLQLSEQVGQVGAQAEGMAQEMNTAAISVGQLATQTGIAEPQMVSLINNISNVTFPNDEAMMYVKSLDQMGVSAENLATSATNIDKINDAFGLGAQTTNSLAQELGVLGVDMNNVSSSFNALAYANSNTVGGMQNYYTFLRKYDSQFKELGFDVDQSSMIIAAATQKYGGGRAALSGLSSALEECDGDTRKLEQALGMQAGSLDHASEITGQYEGQLQQLADEEAEHKTLTDQLGAAWEDVSLSLSGVLSPLGSFVGLIGSAGSFALQINGLKALTDTMKGFNIQQTITNALEGEGAIARVASALGITTEAAAADTAAVSFGGLAIAEGAALWVVLAIAAAIAALILIVYEVGKAFGWWDNVGEMLNAVWAGIQRLWAAFINHPDVQATIQALSEAWEVLSAAIGGVISWIGSFFEVSSGSGEFDVVRALIEGIGQAWDNLTAPIRAVLAVVQFLTDAFKNVGSSQIDIVAALTNAWTFIQTYLGNTLLQISMAIVNWGISLFTSAVTAGQQFVTGVITYVRTLPTKMLVLLLLAYTHVRNQFTKMVTTAKNKITSLVTGVINKLTSLPGKAYNQLKRVVTSVANAGGEWVSKAKAKAGDVVSGVKNVLSGTASSVSSALSGVVNAITAPFKKGYEEAKKWWNKAKNLGGAAGGDPLDEAYGGDPLDLLTGQPFNISTGGYTIVESETTLNVNETLTLDLKNVPNSVNEAELMVWLKSAVGDKGLIRTLVENKDFQALDSKMKESLAKKNARRM